MSNNAVRFRANPNFRRDFLETDDAQTVVGTLAEEAAQVARSIGPVGGSPAGEHYVDQIEAEVGFNDRGELVGRVNANKWTSLFIELGTTRYPAFAVLRRALEAIGFSRA